MGLRFLYILALVCLCTRVFISESHAQQDVIANTDITGEVSSIEQISQSLEDAVIPKLEQVSSSAQTTLFQTGYQLFTSAQAGNKDAEMTLKKSADSTESMSALYGDDESLVRACYLMVMYGAGSPAMVKNTTMAEILAERTLPFLQRQLRSLTSKDEDYRYVALMMYFIHSEGWGVTADIDFAMTYLQASANTGLPAALNLLAGCYIQGKGVEKDHSKAVTLFRQSAEQEDVFGELYYGLCFYYGHGVEKNLPEAFAWFRKAAEAGFSEAEYLVGHCYATGQGVGVLDFVEAARWYERAAAKGQAEAQFSLGYYYNVGKGGKARDLQMAMYWYKIAHENGNRDANFFLSASTFIDHVAAVVEQLYPFFVPVIPYIEYVYSLFPHEQQ